MWIKKAEYNGWVNYETWAMNLWIENDPGTQDEMREICQNAVDREESVEDAIHAARSVLEDTWEERKPDLGATVWSDFVTTSFGEVHWYDIVEDVVKELWEEKPKEEELR